MNATMKLKQSVVRGLAVAALAIPGAAALASEWAFDDPYWQRPGTTSHVAPKDVAGVQNGDEADKYRLVDRYNP